MKIRREYSSEKSRKIRDYINEMSSDNLIEYVEGAKIYNLVSPEVVVIDISKEFEGIAGNKYVTLIGKTDQINKLEKLANGEE